MSCTIAAIRKDPFCKRSLSSSNNKAVRQPQPFGAFGRSVPLCFKLPNIITSLLDGQISWIGKGQCIRTRKDRFFCHSLFSNFLAKTGKSHRNGKVIQFDQISPNLKFFILEIPNLYPNPNSKTRSKLDPNSKSDYI